MIVGLGFLRAGNECLIFVESQGFINCSAYSQMHDRRKNADNGENNDQSIVEYYLKTEAENDEENCA